MYPPIFTPASLRLKKEEVVFICGSDEYGVPITIRAKKEGITPQEVCDRYNKIIKDSFKDLESRLTSLAVPRLRHHHKFAADFFRKLYDDGKLVEQESEQLYDEEAHQFLADR